MQKNTKKNKYKIENLLFQDYLEKGEKIKYVIHLHPVLYHVRLAKIKIPFFVLPVILFIIFPSLHLISIGIMLIGLVRMALLVFDWYYNCWLVTNKGVISIEAEDVWHRHASRTEHEMIAGTAFEKKGFIGSLLDYGTITLEKAGNSKTLIQLKKVKNPLEAELKIVEHQKAYMEEKSEKDNQRFNVIFNKMTHAYSKSRASL